jgi:hypothetical protein
MARGDRPIDGVPEDTSAFPPHHFRATVVAAVSPLELCTRPGEGEDPMSYKSVSRVRLAVCAARFRGARAVK